MVQNVSRVCVRKLGDCLWVKGVVGSVSSLCRFGLCYKVQMFRLRKVSSLIIDFSVMVSIMLWWCLFVLMLCVLNKMVKVVSSRVYYRVLLVDGMMVLVLIFDSMFIDIVIVLNCRVRQGIMVVIVINVIRVVSLCDLLNWVLMKLVMVVMLCCLVIVIRCVIRLKLRMKSRVGLRQIGRYVRLLCVVVFMVLQKVYDEQYIVSVRLQISGCRCGLFGYSGW